MAFIYKITNDINNKIYIGYTTKPSILDRWKEHIKALNAGRQTHLYAAMRLYGVNHFKIHQIEECDNDCAPQREIYWIEQLDTYNTGYNMTRGGDGGRTVSTEQLWETRGIPVYQYDLYGNFINKFDSSGAAASFTHTSQSEIVRCITHNRGALTANNYFWVYEKDISMIPNLVKENLTKYGNTYLIQKDINTHEIVAIYPSVTEAARKLNVCRTNFFRILKKEKPIGYGYLWEQIKNK